MRHTLHIRQLFSPQQVHLQLTQHLSTAYLHGSSSEQVKCSNKPPAPIPTVRLWNYWELVSCVAWGLLQLWGNSSDWKMMSLPLCSGEDGPVSSAEPDLAIWSKKSPGKSSAVTCFHTGNNGICIWYISAQYVDFPTALTVCYAFKIEFLVT